MYGFEPGSDISIGRQTSRAVDGALGAVAGLAMNLDAVEKTLEDMLSADPRLRLSFIHGQNAANEGM